MAVREFNRFFNPKELGESLKEIGTDLIQTDSQNLISRWLHSEKGVDLFIWIDEDKNIIKQQLSFHGQVLEWNLLDGIKTGMIFEEEQARLAKPSELVSYDQGVQSATLKQGMELIGHILVLSDIEKRRLITNFKENPSFPNLTPEEFLTRYRRLKSSKKTTWWQKIKSWVGPRRK